jgi:hypothetical protein
VSTRRQHACTLGLFLVVSALFSWPLVTAPGSIHVSRQFDLYSLLWLVDAMGSPEASLHYSQTSWPVGESLNRMDSFLIAGLAWLGHGILSGRVLAAILALLGPAISAFAAERVAAVHFGARWPWSILAGLSYAFSGMAATSLLEGHIYALVNPWLPLLLGAMMTTLGPQGRPRDGALAALWWVLCLLTSAYTGIAASLLVIVVAGASRFWKRDDWRPAIAAGTGMLVVGLGYAALFAQSGASVRDPTEGMASDPLKVMMAGSVHLDSLAGWTGIMDLHLHSVTGTLGFSVLVLSLLSPLILGRTQGMLVVLATLGIVLSFGPLIQLSDGGLNLPAPISLLGLLGDKASFFNFPSRMLWLAHLALGILAAVVMTRLSERLDKRWCLPILGFALVDVFFGTGTPLRTARVPLDVPSVYALAPSDRAILELGPQFGSFGTDLSLLTNNLGCANQSSHGRPVANQCLGTTVGSGTRSLNRWLNAAVYQRSLLRDVPQALGEMGFGAIVVRPDLYAEQDRRAVIGVLTQVLGEPLGQSTDAGEYLVMFQVPEVATTPTSRHARYAQIRAAYP